MLPVITAFIIFIITYGFIGLRQIPRVHIDRPAGALVGDLITVITILIGILALVLQVPAAHGAEARAGVKQKEQMIVTVTPSRFKTDERKFAVVLYCDTDALRAKGLQGFRPLKQNEAALFALERAVPATFWMGSVTFPIDIIFIGPDQGVARVYSRCMPGSRQFYPSGAPVKWVLETAAGSGIKVGDRVRIE